MNVILLERLANLGDIGDEVAVKAGFARNFLIPKGKAYEANASNKRQIESLKILRAQREASELADAEKKATKIKKLRLKLELATGQGGKAFGSITVPGIWRKMRKSSGESRISYPKLLNP